MEHTSIIDSRQKVRGAARFALASTLAKVPSRGIFPDSTLSFSFYLFTKASCDDRNATAARDNARARKKK